MENMYDAFEMLGDPDASSSDRRISMSGARTMWGIRRFNPHPTWVRTTVFAAASDEHAALDRVGAGLSGMLNDWPGNHPRGVERELARLPITYRAFDKMHEMAEELERVHDHPVILREPVIVAVEHGVGRIDRMRVAIDPTKGRFTGRLLLDVPGTRRRGHLVLEIETSRSRCATCVYRTIQWGLLRQTFLKDSWKNEVSLHPTESLHIGYRSMSPRSDGVETVMCAFLKEPDPVSVRRVMDLLIEPSPASLIEPSPAPGEG